MNTSSKQPSSPRADKSARAICEVLRGRISRRDILPGSKLKETELASEFGVNRARIRQALTDLQKSGLVEHTYNRGTVVTHVDADRLHRIYDVFEVLEGLSAKLAVCNSAPGSWGELVDFFEHPMGEAVARCDYDSFFGGIERYRSTVLKRAANPLLTDVLTSIYDQTQFIIRRTLILPRRAELSLSEHRQILAAMQQGNAEEAQRLKLENMRTAREYLRKYESFIL